MVDEENFEGAAGDPAEETEEDKSGSDSQSGNPDDFEDHSGDANEPDNEADDLADFSSRNRVPVNEVREANKDVVDEFGRSHGKLRLP